MSKRENTQQKIALDLENSHTSTVIGVEGVGSRHFIKQIYQKLDFPNYIPKVNVNNLFRRDVENFYKLLLYEIVTILKKSHSKSPILKELNEVNRDFDGTIAHKVIMESLELLTNIEETNIVISIRNISSLKDLPNHFFDSVRALREANTQKVSFLFIDTPKILTSIESEEFNELIASNVNFIPLPDRELGFEVYQNSKEKFSLTNLSEKEDETFQKIYDLSGGHSGLIKYSVSFIKDNSTQKIDAESLLQYEPIKIRIKRIINCLPEKTKQELFHQNNQFTNNKLLEKAGLLKKNDKTVKIAIPLLSKYIELFSASENTETTDTISSKGLEIQSGVVYIAGDQVADLTKTEFLILRELKNKEGRIIDRESIGKLIWGDEYASKYSDWAIDQTISRLRDKLGESGYSPRFIHTIKGRGFKLFDEQNAS